MYQQENWRETNFLDLWIMEKFSVLPTDKRFLNLYEEQKLALFLGINDLPDLSEYKRIIALQNLKEKTKNKKLEDFVPRERITNMRKFFMKQGLSKEQIAIEIKKYLTMERKKELEKLEKEIKK